MGRSADSRSFILSFGIDNDASPEIQRLSGDLEQLDVKANMVSTALGSGGGMSTALLGGAAAAAAVGAGVVKLTSDYAQNVREAQIMARATNTNVEAMSSLRYAFEQYGYDASDVISLTREVGVALDDALQGNEGKARALELLGADVEALQRLSPDAQLREMVRLIDQLEDRTLVNPITDTLFGGYDGAQIQALAGDLERLEQQARDTGNVITEENAAITESFRRDLDAIEAVISGAGNRIAQGVISLAAPVVREFGESVGLLEDESRDAIDDALEVFLNSSPQASAAGTAFGDAIRQNAKGELDRIPTDAAEVLSRTISEVRNSVAVIQAISGISARDNLPAGAPASPQEALLGGRAYGSSVARAILTESARLEEEAAQQVSRSGPFRDDFLSDIAAGTRPGGSFDPAYAARLEREAQERLDAELQQQRLEALEAAREASAAARSARSEQERLRREEERARAEARRSEIENLQRQATLARRLDDPRAQAARLRELAGQARGTDAELSEDFEYYARQILQREDAREKREVEQEARERQRESRELETHERQVRRGGRELHIVNPGLARPPVVINIYVNGDERPLSDLVRDEVIEGLQDFGSQISDVVATAGD